MIAAWMGIFCLLTNFTCFAASGITDSKGNDLVFKNPPLRVVSLVPSAAEILFEIGAGEAMAGLTYHDATLEGAADKAVVGGFFMPSLERIKALQPDLIILAPFQQQILYDGLDGLKTAGGQTFNPQVIYGCGNDREAIQNFFSRPGWKEVDAVKNNQIYYFPCELTCRASTHSGYFVSWLSSMIYMNEFANPANDILPIKITRSRPIHIDLDYVNSAVINTADIYDFANKTLMVDFKRPQTIVSTLEGQRDNIFTVGNHYSPPPTWGPGHKLGIDDIRTKILRANGKAKDTTAFLITGADMDNLSVTQKRFKEMKVTSLVTAGVLSNAIRMSKDTGAFYEPGTINIIILTNMKLSRRAMTRAIIAATEAKTAALEDMDIRSAYTPMLNQATGTGTDNVLVVQGEGKAIKNAGGHSKMGELIGKAVYDGVKGAVLKQNKITSNRHIFQRLKERKISLYRLATGMNCDCIHKKGIKKNQFAKIVEYLVLEKKYAAFPCFCLIFPEGTKGGNGQKQAQYQ
jgi:iron complex transport system substrate-binding protein